jgi:hypothetical protein
MGKAKTQSPRGTHIKSNGARASTGTALAYLALKKNTGGPRFEREGEKEAALVKKKNDQHGGGQNSASRRLTQQSNCPQASSGMALVDLTIKKNAGGPRTEEGE